jgi:hypothetical protein
MKRLTSILLPWFVLVPLALPCVQAAGVIDVVPLRVDAVAFHDEPLHDLMSKFSAMARKTAPDNSGPSWLLAVPPAVAEQRVTVNVEAGTLLNALKTIGAKAGCEVQLEKSAAVFREKGAPPLPPIVWKRNTKEVAANLEKMRFPRLEFRQATVRESVEYLVQKSKQLWSESDVNVVMKAEEVGPSGEVPAAPAQDIPGLPGPPPPPPGPKVNFVASDMPLIEAYRYVAGVAGLQVIVTRERIEIVPAKPAAAKPPAKPPARKK